MALYTYRALDKQGEIIQDNLEGSGEMAVVHELRQQGLLVIDVKEQSAAQKDILAPFKGIKLADLVIFSRLYVEMVKAGEIGGMLDGVLLRLADQLERDQDLRRKIKSALTYPTV